jgi:hypothetical protein
MHGHPEKELFSIGEEYDPSSQEDALVKISILPKTYAQFFCTLVLFSGKVVVLI